MGPSRLPKLATPIHWINPSYLLIKSSNHGLDPLHWFVSRHGRAEGHRNAGLLNPRCEAGAWQTYLWMKICPESMGKDERGEYFSLSVGFTMPPPWHTTGSLLQRNWWEVLETRVKLAGMKRNTSRHNLQSNDCWRNVFRINKYKYGCFLGIIKRLQREKKHFTHKREKNSQENTSVFVKRFCFL